MLNLVEYGSSDEETQEIELSAGSKSDLASSLPKPMSVSRNAQEEGALEDMVVKKHKWEREPNEKPPSKKAKGPVKISIPDIPSDEDSEDEDAPRKVRGPSGPSALLSILPAPKTKFKETAKVSLTRSDGVVEKNTVPVKTTSFVPSTVRSAQKPPLVSSQVAQNESEDEDSGDFFSLETKGDEEIQSSGDDFLNFSPYERNTVSETYGESSSTMSKPSAEIHPSQMYNYASTSSSTTYVSQPSEMDKYEDVRRIIIQNESLGDDYVLPEDLPIVDVSVDTELGNVRENLLKNITDSSRPVDLALEAARASIAGTKKKKDKPNQTAKRKHQITYLAHLAKEREDTLKNQWAQNRHNKRQTQMKYGF